MTKPVPRIEWSPDRADAHTVWAFARGMGSGYMLHWGDGTQRHMPADARPVPKTYAVAGTYDVVSVSDQHAQLTASAPVTVRTWTVPDVPVSLLPDGRTVQVHLPNVPDPVRWRIQWGDDTTSEHLVGDPLPEHTYEWGIGRPTLVITDVPSRREARVTGPHIGPAPDDTLAGWLADHRGGREFWIRGPADPGTAVQIRSWGGTLVAETTADDRGIASAVVTVPTATLPAVYDTWRSYTVEHQRNALWERTFVPVSAWHAERDEPQAVYQIDPDDPALVTVSSLPALFGEHHIDWGDGTDETVEVTQRPLLAQHRYTRGRSYWLTVTLPDGRVCQRRRVGPQVTCAPTYNQHYPGKASLIWWDTRRSCGQAAEDDFTPVLVCTTEHWMHQMHCPNREDGWGTGYGYRFGTTGDKLFECWSPLDERRTYWVTIGAVARIRPVGQPLVEQIVVDDPLLTAEFSDVTEWDGGYKGRFHVHNHSGEEVPAWQIEFALAEPAVLREVWPSHAQYTDLGNGRWRISSHKPIPASTDVAVNARVEPPGKTRKWPDDITARPT